MNLMTLVSWSLSIALCLGAVAMSSTLNAQPLPSRFSPFHPQPVNELHISTPFQLSYGSAYISYSLKFPSGGDAIQIDFTGVRTQVCSPVLSIAIEPQILWARFLLEGLLDTTSALAQQIYSIRGDFGRTIYVTYPICMLMNQMAVNFYCIEYTLTPCDTQRCFTLLKAETDSCFNVRSIKEYLRCGYYHFSGNFQHGLVVDNPRVEDWKAYKEEFYNVWYYYPAPPHQGVPFISQFFQLVSCANQQPCYNISHRHQCWDGLLHRYRTGLWYDNICP